MKCNEIRELLSPYIDYMLEDIEMKEVEEHLCSCVSCNKEYNELLEIVHLLGQVDEVLVPDSLDLRLKKALIEVKNERLSSPLTVVSKKKRSNWRIVSSIAAIFAVGILTYGMYNDIIHIVPDKLNLSDQSGTINKKEAAIETEIPSSDGGNENYKSASLNEELENKAEESFESPIYGIAKDSAVDTARAPMDAPVMDAFGSSESAVSNQNQGLQITGGAPAAESYSDADVQASRHFKAKEGVPLRDCNISMPNQGIERNSAAVKYYNHLIEEKLEGFDYQILDCTYNLKGEWCFKIFIFKGEDGNTYNEEILITGSSGAINVQYSNELMGL